MKRTQYNNQQGQALVLIALAMIALLAILALVLDGGNTFMTRRELQNAADAGALAGASILCTTQSPGAAEGIAKSYAISHNYAKDAEANACYEPIEPNTECPNGVKKRHIVVTASKQLNTFFAHFIGRDNIPVQAVAEAGCFNPTSGKGVLPIAWTCRPPIPGGDSDSDDCEEERVDSKEELEMILNTDPPDGKPVWDELYILMDSQKVGDDLEEPCKPPNPDGWMDCDLNDDGENDLMIGGGRSWLNLDGGSGNNQEMVSWMDDGFPDEINTPIWLRGTSGNHAAAFHEADEHVGEYVLVPVFDKVCKNGNQDVEDVCDWTEGDLIWEGSGGEYYYRVIGFAFFYISCVDTGGKGTCPGSKVALDQNPDINNSFKSIEGYFIGNEIIPDLTGGRDGGGIDLGVYTVYLTR